MKPGANPAVYMDLQNASANSSLHFNGSSIFLPLRKLRTHLAHCVAFWRREPQWSVGGEGLLARSPSILSLHRRRKGGKLQTTAQSHAALVPVLSSSVTFDLQSSEKIQALPPPPPQCPLGRLWRLGNHPQLQTGNADIYR